VTACVRAAYSVYVGRIGREPAPMTADYGDLIAHGRVYVIPGTSGVRGVLVIEQKDSKFWVDNVAVAPRQQGQGFGKLLLEFAEEQAAAAGFNEVNLYTNEMMTENLAMYQHLGYEEIDRRTDDGFRRVFLRKSLANVG
jgi:GNAT superfamily N-acetyltransferase